MAIKNSIDTALKGNLVIFGVEPTFASTGYGYIKSESQLAFNKHLPYKVDYFTEKPNKATAELFVKDKQYSWSNSQHSFL